MLAIHSLASAKELGPDGSAAFNPLDESQGGKIDTTHLTPHGSDAIGTLVAEELARVAPELASQVNCVGIEPAR